MFLFDLLALLAKCTLQFHVCIHLASSETHLYIFQQIALFRNVLIFILLSVERSHCCAQQSEHIYKLKKNMPDFKREVYLKLLQKNSASLRQPSD